MSSAAAHPRGICNELHALHAFGALQRDASVRLFGARDEVVLLFQQAQAQVKAFHERGGGELVDAVRPAFAAVLAQLQLLVFGQPRDVDGRLFEQHVVERNGRFVTVVQKRVRAPPLARVFSQRVGLERPAHPPQLAQGRETQVVAPRVVGVRHRRQTRRRTRVRVHLLPVHVERLANVGLRARVSVRVQEVEAAHQLGEHLHQLVAEARRVVVVVGDRHLVRGLHLDAKLQLLHRDVAVRPVVFACELFVVVFVFLDDVVELATAHHFHLVVQLFQLLLHTDEQVHLPCADARRQVGRQAERVRFDLRQIRNHILLGELVVDELQGVLDAVDGLVFVFKISFLRHTMEHRHQAEHVERGHNVLKRLVLHQLAEALLVVQERKRRVFQRFAKEQPNERAQHAFEHREQRREQRAHCLAEEASCARVERAEHNVPEYAEDDPHRGHQ